MSVTDEFSEGHCALHAVAQDDYIYMRGLFEFSGVAARLSDRPHYAPHTPINSGEAGPITAATGPTADGMAHLASITTDGEK